MDNISLLFSLVVLPSRDVKQHLNLSFVLARLSLSFVWAGEVDDDSGTESAPGRGGGPGTA